MEKSSKKAKCYTSEFEYKLKKTPLQLPKTFDFACETSHLKNQVKHRIPSTI
jgi:hypothetical protein